MREGLSAAFNVFILVLTSVSVILLLNLFIYQIPPPTDLEWLAVSGMIILIYVAGSALSFAGTAAIEKLFEWDNRRPLL
jgi:hypothetical protein